MHCGIFRWSGQEEPAQANELPEFDPSNPLCPGVKRSNGQVKSYTNNSFLLIAI